MLKLKKNYELRLTRRLSSGLHQSIMSCWIILLFLFQTAIIVEAQDFRRLDEAIPGPFVARLAPVFDFDKDGCLPSAGISRQGQQNGGLKNSGKITGKCRSNNFLETSNTFHRHACVSEGGATYCGHFYALYFEKDQFSHGIDWVGHRHDWEHAAIWTKNGVITHGSASAHGKLETRPATSIIFENGHMRVVYHKHDSYGGTHAMRFANRNDSKAENPYGRFVTPTIVSWNRIHGDGVNNQAMRAKLNNFNYGAGVLPITDKNFFHNLNRFKPPGYPTFDTNGKSCQWVNRISEENGGVGECPSDYLLRAVKCSGRYCDNKDLLCCPYKNSHDRNSRASWSPWFSEEKAGQATDQGFVGGIQCSGKYCDNIRLKFINSKDVKNMRRNHDTGWFSEERPNNFGQCAENEFVSGMKCSGRYCDRINMTCSKASTSGSR